MNRLIFKYFLRKAELDNQISPMNHSDWFCELIQPKKDLKEYLFSKLDIIIRELNFTHVYIDYCYDNLVVLLGLFHSM